MSLKLVVMLTLLLGQVIFCGLEKPKFTEVTIIYGKGFNNSPQDIKAVILIKEMAVY